MYCDCVLEEDIHYWFINIVIASWSRQIHRVSSGLVLDEGVDIAESIQIISNIFKCCVDGLIFLIDVNNLVTPPIETNCCS